jgi:signal transduction histidine kinase
MVVQLLLITEDQPLADTFMAWFPNNVAVVAPEDVEEYIVTVAEPPFVVILDEIPESNKIILRRLWGRLADTSAIAVLASDEQAFATTRHLGAVEVLLKPLHPDWTRHRIAQTLRWMEQHRALQVQLVQQTATAVSHNGQPCQRNNASMTTQDDRSSDHDVFEIILRKEQELNQLKQRFMTMAAHEFRTPLTVIASASEMLLEFGSDMSPEEQRNYLVSIRERVQHLKRTLAEIERLIHADYQTFDLKPEPVDVVALCHEAVEALRVNNRIAHMIQVEVIDPPCSGLLDPDKVRYIVDELLTNAIKFSSPDQPIELEVRCEYHTVYLTVTDLGIGVPTKEQSRLFDLFFQGSNIGAIGGKGRGMGLKLVRDYVQAHQGKIHVVSVENEGTQVTVMLPLRHTFDAR